MNNIYQVIAVGESQHVVSNQTPEKTLTVRTVVLREIGGTLADTFVCTLMSDGNDNVAVGQLVAASLRFKCKEYNGRYYQDIICREIQIIKP